MHNVRVYERLPKEEARLGMRVLVQVGLFLNRRLPQMTPDLPEIHEDINEAMKFGLTSDYRNTFRAPRLPLAFSGQGPPNLEDLAVESPYSVFLERGEDGQLQWDFQMLGEFEHQPGLRSLGLRVVFSESDDARRLTTTKIISEEYGEVSAGSEDWDASRLLAVCAATTHMSLTRHFNYVHLISGNHWDVATRNFLPSTHRLYRLLWPHLFNSLYTNHAIARVQLLPDGDYVNMFSFTHDGLMKYYDAMYECYDIRVTDPEVDWKRRGLTGTAFDCPTHDNLVDLFDVMHAHAKRYIYAYYASDTEIQRDTDVTNWIKALNGLVPNGIGGTLAEEVTRDGLARAIGAYMFEGNTIHELSGTALWDYQLWADKNPTRIYQNGRRIPLDVYQRIINNNFALQLERAPLLANYGHVTQDQLGRNLFTRFCVECRELQVRYSLGRWHSGVADSWKMEPRQLEISMNG
jgi:hypothetical protein